MTEFSRVNIEGNLYDVKDSISRTKISINEGKIAALETLVNNLSTLPLELTELKMLGWTTPPQMKVKNSVSSDGTFTQRVGRICLGDMAWNYAETNKAFYSNSINALIKSNTTNLESSKLKSWGFTPYLSAFDTYSDNGMGVNGTTLYSKATSYTSASAFKSAMANTYLYYELATPVTKNVYDRNIFDREV